MCLGLSVSFGSSDQHRGAMGGEGESSSSSSSVGRPCRAWRGAVGSGYRSSGAGVPRGARRVVEFAGTASQAGPAGVPVAIYAGAAGAQVARATLTTDVNTNIISTMKNAPCF